MREYGLLKANTSPLLEKQFPVCVLWTVSHASVQRTEEDRKQGEESKGHPPPSLVTNLENTHFGHFCWLEWQLMKMKHAPYDTVITLDTLLLKKKKLDEHRM